MYCLEHCFHCVPGYGSQPALETRITNHCAASNTGRNFYFCAEHRAYHCMYLAASLDQPLCGECAPLYYHACPETTWLQQFDRRAQRPALEGSHGRVMTDWLIDIDMHIQRSRDNNHVNQAASSQPPAASNRNRNLNRLFRIPREGAAYRDLGTILLANPRQPGLRRLCFRSPTGAIGWMPCGPDINSRAEFIYLAPHERHGDVVFKRFRVWACRIQGIGNLPKDVRWCLLTIYMMCTEVLYNSRHVVEEDDVWQMRCVIIAVNQELQRLSVEHGLRFPTPSPAQDWRLHEARPPSPLAAIPSATPDSDSDDDMPVEARLPFYGYRRYV
ncbi:hypothetical protein ACQKWADRAFT_48290 [Trichoderma austrokoningii]